MQLTFAVLFILSVALPLAEGRDPSPSEAIGASVAVAPSAHLAAAVDGRGLVGSGAGYRVRFAAGMRFEPGRDGERGPHLALVPVSVRRGALGVLALPSSAAPERIGRTARYAHAPGVTERYEVRPEGVELSWVFDAPPPGEGDLVVRYAVDTSLPAPQEVAGGLAFELPGTGGTPVGVVSIGAVTGIDARGAKVAGAMRFAGGMLELSLPAAFVAGATYPLVLDPVIGSIVTVASGSSIAGHYDPDAAFDATTSRYLVAWNHVSSNIPFPGHSYEVRGQRVTVQGTVVGAVIHFVSTGVTSRPRVANLGSRDRFGVVWTQLDGSTSSVRFAAVDASTGVITHTFTAISSTSATYLDADIGCESEAAIGAARGFVVVYEDNGMDAIRARRVWFNASDQLAFGAAFSVFTDTALGSTYTEPTISRTASGDGNLLVVAHRFSILSGTSSIVGTVVASNSSVAGPTVTVYSNPNYDVSVPDVDGFAGQWVVAWQRDPVGTIDSRMLAAPVSMDASGNSLSVGTVRTFGSSSAWAAAPAVGYTPGKTWLGYRSLVPQPSPLPGIVDHHVTGIDGGSCISCNDTFTTPNSGITFPPPGGRDRIVPVTMTSGASTSGEDALALWSVGGDLFAQRLRNHSTGGGISNVGGGCGAGGTQSYSHNPAIGSSGLVCTVDALPAGTLATIFNFSAQGQAIPCGPCSWRPFSVTLTPPIVAGSASVEFPIPCLSSLVGSTFESQWTSLYLPQAPCVAFPGITLSDRLVLQIGP